MINVTLFIQSVAQFPTSSLSLNDLFETDTSIKITSTVESQEPVKCL